MNEREREEHQQERAIHALEQIAHAIQNFANNFDFLNQHLFAALNFQLVQFKGELSMPITGVQAGGSGVFQAVLVPANAAKLQSGPVFTSDDANVTLTPDPTDAFKVTAAVAAGDTAASFNLKVDGVNGAGTAITHTFAVPIIAAPPPQAIDFDLNQIS
jgi:hypothetical protein